MRTARGYTLVELIISLAISGIVLAGILSIASSMIRQALLGTTSADVAGWSILGLHQLDQDLENASYLNWPALSISPGGALSINGCINWSDQMANGIFANGDIGGLPMTAFFYTTATVSSIPTLVRYSKMPSAISDCKSFNGTGATSQAVIAKQVYQNKGLPIFTISGATNTLHVEFLVGIATAVLSGTAPSPAASGYNQATGAGRGLAQPTPTYLLIRSDIRLNKSINGASNSWE